MQPLVDDSVLCLLKCGKTPNLVEVLHLHARICELGVEVYPAVGNHLIFKLAEVESFGYADQVFNRLVHKSESSWSSLLTACVKCSNLQLALELYQKMQENGFLTLTSFAFIALLKACGALKDLDKGSKLHDLIISRGSPEMDACIGSMLVNMYCKCGALTKAHDVLVNLPIRDVVSWTALVAGYADYGCGDEVFICIEDMQNEGISPNAHTLVCSLKVCCTMEVLEKGQEVHANIVKKGFDEDLPVSNTLIDMYAKCGPLETAQSIFDCLPSRTLVSWTVLLVGYTEHSHSEEALSVFHRMREERISPDAATFVCSLKACSSLGEASEGLSLHCEIVAKGLETELLVGSAVVDMYTKCGLLREAYSVFGRVPNKDGIVWATLMAGYVDLKCHAEALACFEKMQSDGVSPNTLTFVSALQACAHLAAIFVGQEIHAEIIMKGLEQEPLIGSNLVDMYTKRGWLTEAQVVFDKFPSHHVLLWTSLLAGHAEQGLDEKTLDCFVEMENRGVAPSTLAFVYSLKACLSAGFFSMGLELHAEVVKRGLEEQPLVGNTLVDMYIKFGFLATARSVFDRLSTRDVISWNALIGGYVDCDRGEEALCVFEQMRCEGIVYMNNVTFVCTFKACGSIGASLMGHKVHARIIKRGLEKVTLVCNALMDMYGKCGLVAEAQKAFDCLLDRDVISWNTLIAAYAQLGKSGLVFIIVDTMLGEGIKPDLITLISVVNGCSHAGSVEEGFVLFGAFHNPDHGIIPTLEHYSCLIDLLGRAGHLEKAFVMIARMPLHPDVVVWHTILGACQGWGNAVLGRHAYDHALEFGGKTAALYLCMYSIYFQAALPEEAKKIEQMRVRAEHLREQWKGGAQFWA